VARFIVRRLIGMVFVLFAVSVLTFLIFNVIPNGDPAVRLAGKSPSPELIASIREEFGFNESLPVQYLNMMEQVFTGKLISYEQRINVVDQIIDGAPRTFALAIGAAIIWLVLGVALGLFSAVRAGRVSDRILTVLAIIGISMPVFWVGALMNYYLGFKLKIFPNGGYVPFGENPLDWLYHLIMPWTALALLFIGVYSRILRSNVLDTMNDDYVRTARARACPSGGSCCPRPAQLAHPRPDPVGPGLRARPRRGRDPHRDRVRHPGRRGLLRPSRSARSTCPRCSRSSCSARSSSCC
jgi:peptide/nickel transport system permease protein